MTVDLCMWTLNGERTLAAVLNRINKVVPRDSVNQRFIVDDHSSDSTREIAKLCGWKVTYNRGKGISDGANTALNQVAAPYFCSFEQDLLLSPSWWRDIAEPFFTDERLGASSGTRFSSEPVGLTNLQKYVAKKYLGEKELSPWLNGRKASAFTLGKTLDNTIYRTEAMRKIGGYPKIKTNAGVDTVLAYSLSKAGYPWRVDYNVQSVHLRTGLRDELAHQFSYGTQIKSIMGEANYHMHTRDVFYHLLISPFSAVFVALKVKEPSVVYIHPLIRLYYTMGLIRS